MNPTSLILALTAFLAVSQPSQAAQVPLTIMHTNDLHSHYRPDKGPFGLGGIGRLATTIRQVRASVQNSLLLDGGDWSEGNIYYNLDAGRTALEMMNTLGYDAAVVGNHDWLNGPDQLVKLFTQVPPRFPILGANLDFSKYKRAAEISKYITPYRILNVGSMKIAVMGLVTYELVYDRWFAPVEIKDPFGLTRKLAARLKKEADLVIVISHNGMATNKLIAGLPNVDVVIHAHDHQKLPRPIVIERNGKTSVMVEAQNWGFYLGRLDLLVDTEKKSFSVKNYELIQMDSTIPDDPAVASLVNNYDRQIEQKYGDIFHDHLADSNVDVRREGPENIFGNLLTDAYRDFAGADVSFEQASLTSGELHKGALNSVDLYNALAQIWDPKTDKSWTLKTMRMTGETLSWVLNFVLSASSYIPGGQLSVSGVHAVYDPMVLKNTTVKGEEKRPLRSLEIGGKPVDMKRSYLVAVPEGINQAIDFMETFLGNKIDRTDVTDTHVEDWRILAKYVTSHSPLDPSKLARGGRIAVLQSDLALYHDEVSTSRAGHQLWASVTVRNMGTTESIERKLSVTYDKTPRYVVDDPNPAEIDNTFTVQPIAAGGKAVVRVSLTLPVEMAKERVPIYFRLNSDASDPGKNNDGTWIMLETDDPAPLQ